MKDRVVGVTSFIFSRQNLAVTISLEIIIIIYIEASLILLFIDSRLLKKKVKIFDNEASAEIYRAAKKKSLLMIYVHFPSFLEITLKFSDPTEKYLVFISFLPNSPEQHYLLHIEIDYIFYI